MMLLFRVLLLVMPVPAGGIKQRHFAKAKPKPCRQLCGLKGKTFDRRGKTTSADGFLQNLFKQGRISAPELVEGACSIRNSGASGDCTDWAKAGNGGLIRGNCSRDVMAKLDKHNGTPPLYSAKCKFWNPDLEEPFEDECYIQLPHEIVDHEITSCRIDDFTVNIDDPSAVDLTTMGWADSLGIGYSSLVGLCMWGMMLGISRETPWY